MDEDGEVNSSEENSLLPPAFSLLSSLKVPITVTAAEVFDYCKRRKEQKLARLNRPKSGAHAVEPAESVEQVISIVDVFTFSLGRELQRPETSGTL